MTISTIYNGNLRTEATHLDSGAKIITDAPKDNQGQGEGFSPTDLLVTALSGCMVTIIGIAARTHGFSIDGTTTEVTKIMATEPRRVGEIKIVINLPANITYSEKERRIIESAAHSCPVAKSLHPDLIQNITFNY